MNKEATYITLTAKEIAEYPFVTVDGKCAFYRYIVEKIGLDYDTITSIDCQKINVAKNIQDAWFGYAKENNIPIAELTMVLLMSGPKAEERIPDNTVEIEYGAITL